MNTLILLAAALAGILSLGKGFTTRFPSLADHANGSAKRHASEQPIELVLDLGASLLDSGMPITQILDLLGSSIEQCAVLRSVARCLEMNLAWDKAWEAAPQWLAPLRKALLFAHTTGAPAANLLRNTAALQRREHAQKVARLGAQFATKLVLPLGACALPAFIALGVVPLIIALFPSM
ncbi:type II secretion system F family protein [Glutamicibacter sp. JC586]|uniref:type II secretion system F family protein n=1 Tax=Glutamicibacter sp. JC586 TaxID=2590552 RepID=UPI00135B027A|nr:type II secretion system F family protein [Glutamicibacter sp. JC586]